MNLTNLDLGTSVTTNGSDLTNTQIGAQQAGLSQTGSSGLVGSNTLGTDVSVGGTNSISGMGNSFFKNNDGSFNSDNLGMVIGGIQTLGSLWNSYQQQKIAKESLALQRQAFQTNLKNNTQTYNTALEDQIRARHYTEGKSSDATESYLSEHKL